MAMEARKRQQKLERRKAKAKKRALAKRTPGNLDSRLDRAHNAPILHCCTTDMYSENGICNVLISRRLTGGSVGFAVFLVDVYCLGVKNVILNILPRSLYNARIYEKLQRNYELVTLAPSTARKFVESAVDYAASLGLPPHRDYTRAKHIFGDIDADFSIDEFEFGRDGKPFFIAGPHDNLSRCQRIIETLKEHCGPDGFDHLIPVSGGSLSAHEASDLGISEWGEFES